MENVVSARSAAMRERIAMYNANALKIGIFGANCSSGRSATKVPERWSASWPDCRRLARMADAAGIDFMLPIGRWKGYGGDTDFHGSTLETITWAVGLLSATERMTVFGTVHAPLFHPLIAAKEFVTADHVGEGRFGVNLVVGWNEGEFEMFGVTQREHDTRYDFAQEWLDVVKRAWSERGDFDFHGRFLDLKGVRADPKPYGDTRPIIMNAGSSEVGQAFALRNCDAFFVATAGSRTSLEGNAKKVAEIRSAAQRFGRDIEIFTVGQVRRRRRTTIATPSSKTPIGVRSTACSRTRTSRRRRLRPRSTSRNASTLQPTRSAATPSSERRTAWRTSSRPSTKPACAELRSPSSTISTSCRTSATRCCRAWCGSAREWRIDLRCAPSRCPADVQWTVLDRHSPKVHATPAMIDPRSIIRKP